MMSVDVGLQLRLALQPQFLHLGLALGTSLPAVARTLVAAYVYELAGEHPAHLVHHLVQEVQRPGVARAEHVLRDAPLAPHAVGAARAAQFGIYAQRGHHVSGQVYLGDDGDEALLGIAHNLPHLLLGVVARLGRVVIDGVVRVAQSQIPAHNGARAHAGLGGQFGH